MRSREEIEERITRLTQHAEFFKNEILLLDSGKSVYQLDNPVENNKIITKELMRIEEDGFRAQIYALRWVLMEELEGERSCNGLRSNTT